MNGRKLVSIVLVLVCMAAPAFADKTDALNILLITLLILGVIGCSNKAVYENIRINQSNDLIK